MSFTEPQLWPTGPAGPRRAPVAPGATQPSPTAGPDHPVVRTDDALGRDLATAVLQRRPSKKPPPVPGRMQILYESDHAGRAAQMVQTHPSAYADAIAQKAPEDRNIDMIVLWGHGTDNILLGTSDTVMAKKLANWKHVDPRLTTVGVITCNTRHFNATYQAAIDENKKKGYIDRLKKNTRSKGSTTKDITFKALPVSEFGKKNTWSILLHHDPSQGWVYVTGHGTEQAMFDGKNLIEFVINPTTGGAVSYTGDIVTRAQQVLAGPTGKDRKRKRTM